MAVPCPCACGRSISRLVRRGAERGVFIGSLTAIPTRLAEVIRSDDPQGAAQLDEFAGIGHVYSHGILGSAHRDPFFSPAPSGKSVGVWEAAAFKLLHSLQARDQQWYENWEGPVRNRLTGKGGRRRSAPSDLLPDLISN